MQYLDFFNLNLYTYIYIYIHIQTYLPRGKALTLPLGQGNRILATFLGKISVFSTGCYRTAKCTDMMTQKHLSRNLRDELYPGMKFCAIASLYICFTVYFSVKFHIGIFKMLFKLLRFKNAR